jgi:hypothetical protein
LSFGCWGGATVTGRFCVLGDASKQAVVSTCCQRVMVDGRAMSAGDAQVSSGNERS